LWRYCLPDILDRWHELFDELALMKPIYVPGNHEKDLAAALDMDRPHHPFFDCLQPAYVQTIGDRTFKFMHGHEIDPFSGDLVRKLTDAARLLAYPVEYNNGICLLTSDLVSDTLLEICEQGLGLWRWLFRKAERAADELDLGLPSGWMTRLRRPIRTRNMLVRFYENKSLGLYDAVVAGHTHAAGRFADWYFNSGSWTGPHKSFVEIRPDGSVQVCLWTASGALQHDHVVIR